jgi:hypothetical protein
MARGLLRRSILTVFVFQVVCVWAQPPASVSFVLDFPASEPSHYVISLNSDGRGSYDSTGKISPEAEGDPFHLEFTLPSETRTKIFDLARRAHYFEGEIDSKKKNLASTGAKTLIYKDGQRSTKAEYNFSMQAPVQQLTAIFQNLSSTLEFGRRLEYFHRYQKLALDEELKRMEDAARGDGLGELSMIAPILQRIAGDPTVINPVRVRAQRLLQKAAGGKS